MWIQAFQYYSKQVIIANIYKIKLIFSSIKTNWCKIYNIYIYIYIYPMTSSGTKHVEYIVRGANKRL